MQTAKRGSAEGLLGRDEKRMKSRSSQMTVSKPVETETTANSLCDRSAKKLSKVGWTRARRRQGVESAIEKPFQAMQIVAGAAAQIVKRDRSNCEQ